MRTTDRAASDVFTVAQIGRTQEVTPEGFLLCRDVPIARAGEMLYGPGEVPVEVGRDMIARITRGEDVLLAPNTMASYEGKAVTIDHPDEDVNPRNWRQLSVGHVRNVRPGDGIDADKIMADLLIVDEDAIQQVRDGLREVSCGYDAEYEDLGGGRGRQISITGNHVALVRRGRCGPVCSIGDSEMRTRDKSQTTKDEARKSWMDRMKAAFFSKDEDSFVRELQGAPDVAEIDGDPPDNKPVNITLNLNGGGASVAEDPAAAAVADPALAADPMTAIMASLSAIEQRLTALEGGGAAVADPDPLSEDAGDEDDDGDGVPEDEDEDDKDPTKDAATRVKDKTKDAATRDSADLEDEFADTRARAEIVAPGIAVPTFDAATARKATVDSMCALRRRSLARVGDTHKKLIAPLISGLDLKKATCDQVRTAFIGASELIRQSNDARQFIPRRPVRDAGEQKGIPTISQINAKAASVWGARK